MRKRVFFYVLLLTTSLFFVTDIFALDTPQLIKKAKDQTNKLRTIRIKIKSNTNSTDVTYGEALIDYENGEFKVTEENNSQTLRAIYFKDNVMYMFDAPSGEWIKFAKGVNLFSQFLDKHNCFTLFPENFDEAGLDILVLEEEVAAEERCYVLHSKPTDKEKLKSYINNYLDKFFPAQFKQMIENDRGYFDKFLDTYINKLESTLWLSKDKFVPVKVFNTYEQMVLNNESILVENENVFYDANEPVTVTLPSEGLKAQEVSVKELFR